MAKLGAAEDALDTEGELLEKLKIELPYPVFSRGSWPLERSDGCMLGLQMYLKKKNHD